LRAVDSDQDGDVIDIDPPPSHQESSTDAVSSHPIDTARARHFGGCGDRDVD
jgi:hypothetical protein